MYRFVWSVIPIVKLFIEWIQLGKDADPSWKKQIYKVISRLDDFVPEFFKAQTFLDQLE